MASYIVQISDRVYSGSETNAHFSSQGMAQLRKGEGGQTEKLPNTDQGSDRCLRRVTGAYMSTPIPVLEAEAEALLIDLQLDRLLLKSLAKGVHPAIERGCARIRRRLSCKERGRPKEVAITLLKAKVEWGKTNFAEAKRAKPKQQLRDESRDKELISMWWRQRKK